MRETTPGERRVALVPDTVGRLAKAGNEVVIERGAGQASSFPDRMYTDAGATIGDAWSAELIVTHAVSSPCSSSRWIRRSRFVSSLALMLTPNRWKGVVERSGGS